MKPQNYILLSAHREENIDTEKNFTSLFTAINKLAEKYDMPILYSCHPRSRNRLAASGFKLDPRVIQHEPLGFHDYNCLQMNAFAVVSDSGTLPEESSFFTSIGKPIAAVCIRTSTERPEALDKGCFILFRYQHPRTPPECRYSRFNAREWRLWYSCSKLCRGSQHQNYQAYPELYRSCEQDGLAQILMRLQEYKRLAGAQVDFLDAFFGLVGGLVRNEVFEYHRQLWFDTTTCF